MSVDLDLASTARSPDGKFSLTAHQGDFPTASLDRDEANLLERQVESLVTDVNSEILGQVIQDRQEVIARTAAFSKQVFDEKSFEGVNAGDNAIGFSVLRPGHIYSNPSGTLQNDWYFQPGTTGFTDWIGDGTTANNYTVLEDQVVLVLGFLDADTNTEISGLNVDEFGRNMDMLPLDVNDARLEDNQNNIKYQSLPTLIGQENDEIHIRLRADRDAESQPRLLGFTFGLGTFLNTEDY